MGGEDSELKNQRRGEARRLECELCTTVQRCLHRFGRQLESETSSRRLEHLLIRETRRDTAACSRRNQQVEKNPAWAHEAEWLLPRLESCRGQTRRDTPCQRRGSGWQESEIHIDRRAAHRWLPGSLHPGAHHPSAQDAPGFDRHAPDDIDRDTKRREPRPVGLAAAAQRELQHHSAHFSRRASTTCRARPPSRIRSRRSWARPTIGSPACRAAPTIGPSSDGSNIRMTGCFSLGTQPISISPTCETATGGKMYTSTVCAGSSGTSASAAAVPVRNSATPPAADRLAICPRRADFGSVAKNPAIKGPRARSLASSHMSSRRVASGTRQPARVLSTKPSLVNLVNARETVAEEVIKAFRPRSSRWKT